MPALLVQLLLLTASLRISYAFLTPKLTASREGSLRAEATFGMGCFWKPSEELLRVTGVQDTVVGYTGVTEPPPKPPTYETVCFSRDWVEGVRVYYDEQALPYEKLLDAFFMAQEPKIGSRQYGSYIFPHDKEQERIAREWIERNKTQVRSKDGVPVMLTRIEPRTPFFRAENYHQEYWQKTRPRIAAMISLLAVGSGILDNVTPVEYLSNIHSIANALVLAGLMYVLVERKFDTTVVEI